MKSPLLSIVILNYKSEAFCQKCLFSIQKYPPKCEYEILLVDNNSDDESIENLKQEWQGKLPISFFPLPKNVGYGQGNEYALTHSKGEFFAIVNPDIEVHEGTFSGLVQYLENNEDVGLVAPKLVFPNGDIQDSFRRFPAITDLFIKRTPFLRKVFEKRMQKFLMWDIDFSLPVKVDWVVGAFFIARKEAWKDAGGFDRRFFLFLEDTDVCRSLWTQNWEVVFHPKYSATHNHARLSHSEGLLDFFRNKMVRIHFWSALKYFGKWFGKGNPRK